MTSSARDAQQELEQMQKRQRVLADFGDVTLQSEDLDAVLTEACRLVGEALGTGRAKVLEIEPGSESLLVRAGVGWGPDVVGKVRVSLGENSSESYAIKAGRPIITQDISKEERFELPAFLKEAGIVALANVPIFLPGNHAYGLLQVDDTQPRDFDQDDTEFLRTYASVLGPVIDRLYKLEELQASEESLQLIAEEAEDYAIFMMDPEGRITDWLPGAAALFGWSAEEARGQPFSILFTPEDRERDEDRNEIATARAKGMAPNVRWHLCKDGSRVFIEGTLRTLQGPYGRLRGFLKIGQDVTERRRADEALRASEARLRAIVETATDYAIFTMDPEGRLEAWPKGAEHVFGWTAEEAAGQPVEMTYTPEDRETRVPEKEREEAIATGQAPNVRWHVRKDGSRVFIDGVARPLTGPDGALQGFVKVGKDVTERRATEEALRASEERFQQFGDASADVLWIRNAGTLEFEYLSPAVEEVHGVRADDLLTGNHVRRWPELIVPEDRDLALDHVRRAREGEHVLNAFRVRRPDGEVRWIRDTSFPLRDEEGRVHRFGGIAHDATEEVETHDRLHVLVAELQHRTRNLMGVARSVTDKTLASSTSLPDFQGRIRDRLNALARVNGLLSRLDGGNRITFDELIRTELMAHGVVDGTQGPTSQVTLDGPEGMRLRSSTVQTFALALHELATNALKYGALSRPEGRLVVSWNLVNGEDGQTRLRVDWRESGVPVAAQDGELLDGSVVSRRRGYGRELIERALPYQLKAETSYTLGPDGAHCTITLPVSSTMSTTRPLQEEPDA